MTDFLHGVETIKAATSNGSIDIVKTAVALLVGISPDGPTQQLIQCLNEKDDAQFGAATPANDIALALSIIRSEAGSSPVIVINVFDSTKHTDDLNVTGVVTSKKFALKKHLYGTIVVKKADTTVVDPSKYTFDAYGNFTDITDTGELEGLTLTVTGKYVIPAQAADIVGAVAGDGTRTGLKLGYLSYDEFGYLPKIILAPRYSTLSTVFTEARNLTDFCRGTWLHDSDVADSVADAQTNRGSTGTIGWNTSHKRSVLLYDGKKVYNSFEGDNIVVPYSMVYAGVMIQNDKTNGYWFSPSNKEMKAPVGNETQITTSFNDSSAENQVLNSKGIVCHINLYGSAMRTYGNRNAGYPTESGADTFISVQRADDIIAEAMELAAATKYSDQPITQGLVDVIREDGNALMGKLVQRGALLPGSKISYEQGDNSSDELAAGHTTFRRTFMVPTPNERMTYVSVLDIDLLKFK